MARIAVGGLQHETNTFAHTRARFEDFVQPDAWPGLTRGNALFDAVGGINLPISGFIEQARSDGHQLLPLPWSSAQPSGPVTRDAFERLVALLLEDLRAALPVDAIYLDLHGAMVAEHLDDADGELLTRIRRITNGSVPIIASLDLHANVSPAMVDAASLLVAYRTYPHVDMAATGARAASHLGRVLHHAPLQRDLRQLDFLVPLAWQCTLISPMRELVQAAIDATRGSIVALEIVPGFPLADVADCGPAIFGYGEDPGIIEAVHELARVAAAGEAQFAGRTWKVEDAVRHALEIANVGLGPVILVDSQDNPGAGGNADTTTLLKTLIARNARGALCGIWCDPEVAAAAHAAGVGRTITAALGGKIAFPGETPLRTEFRVEALGDGRFTGTGPFYRGTRMELGPMARLGVGDVHIVVASRKQQAADQAMFRHLGAEPERASLLLLKSTVHFRADFGDMASEILLVDAPGPSPSDPSRLAFRKLRPGVRLSPRGQPVPGADL